MAPSMAEKPNRLSLDADSFADVIKTVLKNFLKMKLKHRKSSKRSGRLVVDIELIEKHDFYTVQMTHCGQWTEKGIHHLFNQFNCLIDNHCLPPNTVVANVFERVNAEDGETIYDIEGGQAFFEKKNIARNRIVHLPFLKNYVLIRLRYRLQSTDLLELEENLCREFNTTKKSHRDVKITFHCKKEVFYSNHVASDEDFQHCELLSLPLIAIIKQTMNNQFKERCLQTLDAQSVYEAQSTLTKRLYSVTHENYIIP